ncbi:deaminase [Rhodococcus sp. NPDC059968]|uniref:deaminase n=1 Tax=Rhodococcus sp. NPDC059968 TaxID=3347017 RepID=UPI00366DD076
MSTDPPRKGPELIFSTVRPLGIDGDTFVDALRTHLANYSYALEVIKVSDLISKLLPEGAISPTTPEDERIRTLIDAGDEECETRQSSAAFACYAVAEILYRRNAETGSPRTALPRTAYLIDSIKRTEEVDLLQRIYGDRYVQFGLKSNTPNRHRALADKLATSQFSKSKETIDRTVSDLMERDQKEEGKFGQKVAKAFPRSDVFIDYDGDLSDQIGRFFSLFFGDPNYKTPKPMEFGMNLAYVSSTRSSELGLKVGAAIVDDNDHIISLGYNHHPTDPDQSPAYDASSNEINSLVLDTLRALKDDALNDETREKLAARPEEFVRELLKGSLNTARIRDLVEFQLTVHAEMSALIAALERGGISPGQTIYVTAYPCHGCAKHIVAAGLNVVYLEPYPKSRAEAMYGESVKNFSPFIGIAPSRYDTLFRVLDERKTSTGERIRWDRKARSLAIPKVSALTDQGEVAKREEAALTLLAPNEDNQTMTTEMP